MNEQKRIFVLQAWSQARELLSAGFTAEEATRLILLREQWRPRLDAEAAVNDHRLALVTWLVQQGKPSDYC